MEESMFNLDGTLRKQPAQPLYPEETYPEEPEQEEEVLESTDEGSPAPVKATPKGDYEENVARLRKKNEAMESELEQMRYQMQQMAQQQNARQDDFNLGINDDDLAEGRHLSQLAKEVKSMKEDLRRTREEAERMALENKLKTRHRDFDEVVTTDNLNRLKDEQPEIYRTIISSQDTFAQAVTAYKMIKKFGIVEDEDSSLQKLVANTTKPRLSGSSSTMRSSTALSNANSFADGITPEMKRALLKEMAHARNS